VSSRAIHRTALQPRWLLYTWFLSLILGPFYIFGSGMPQPGDWLLAILLAYIFFNGISPRTFRLIQITNLLRWFVIYVCMVTFFWYFFIDQSKEVRFPTIFFPAFYIFNFLILRATFVLSEYFKKEFLITTAYGIGLSLIIQTVLSFAMGSTSSRNSLFFNNPNQLGYYALLSGSLFIYAMRFVKLNSIFQIVTYLAFLYLTLLSSSKAALAGSVILITLAVVNQGFLNVRQLLVITLAAGSIAYFVLNQKLGSDLLSYSLGRFQTIGQSKDDSYEGRGYDRIINNPEYLLFGAGEGGYSRFDTLLKHGEIHSSFGTLLFCYGIIGFTLFFRFLFSVFQGSKLFGLLYFIPVAAYSVTHQGLRDSLFWVFLGVVCILNDEKLQIARKKISGKVHRQYVHIRPKVISNPTTA